MYNAKQVLESVKYEISFGMDKAFQKMQLPVNMEGTNIYYESRAMFDHAILSHSLKKTRGNVLKAAKMLGLNRNTVTGMIKTLGIDMKEMRRRG